jgi:tetratricopeptide (TPR) repeat protein
MRATIAAAVILFLCGLAPRAWSRAAASVPADTPARRKSMESYLDGVLLFQKGDYEGSRKVWRAALKADPSNEDARVGLEKIRELLAPPEASKRLAKKTDASRGRELRRVMDEAQEGAALSTGAVAALKRKLASAPEDLPARHRLLGYYGTAEFGSDAARAAREEQVLWLIAHHPEDLAHQSYGLLNKKVEPEAYEKGKALWLEQVDAHSDDPLVLGHAADFLTLDDPLEAEKVLLKAEALEPADPAWPNKLGSLYTLRSFARSPDDARDARSALAAFEKARSLSASAAERFYNLDDLGKAALAAGEYDKARRYAGELLAAAPRFPKNWNYGNALHLGNLVLGRLALRDGKLKEAEAFLAASAETPGSPQLDSFGPNMALAKELLEKGRRRAVLDYFSACRRFWKHDGGLLDEWSREVKDGKVPDFGGNLNY